MAKKETNLTLGISEPKKVDEFMLKLEHPLLDLIQCIRSTILSVDDKIGEGIYWNAPTFFYTGAMSPFEPKEYKRYIVGFNFYQQDTIRLVFLKGVNANDPTGLLEGNYKDGRRIASIKSVDDLKNKEQALKNIVSQLVKLME